MLDCPPPSLHCERGPWAWPPCRGLSLPCTRGGVRPGCRPPARGWEPRSPGRVPTAARLSVTGASQRADAHPAGVPRSTAGPGQAAVQPRLRGGCRRSVCTSLRLSRDALASSVPPGTEGLPLLLSLAPVESGRPGEEPSVPGDTAHVQRPSLRGPWLGVRREFPLPRPACWPPPRPPGSGLHLADSAAGT